ncbi:hypothetical protein K3X13_06175 [Aliiroseovarius crassostreae]|uniref:hypothetical protein n=1 Tax=Aliiroseovarius crassostreae TaxID=154981 RepID=UPI0022081933|nr:hypothetical protein [Aliiroseovarius crassostreae]UWP93405.1 hypothetical protein K3X13_06175 [Aliiroseovarius crassostreae]
MARSLARSLICALATGTLSGLAAPGLVMAQQSSNAPVSQQGSADKPLSAIDWLSNSITLPAPTPPSAQSGRSESDVAQTAAVAAVTVSPLARTKTDAVGLLPSHVTGFQSDLWGASRADDLARRISGLPVDLLPALQDLLNRLLLAELDPPRGTSLADDRLFLARVDRLLNIGALDQADALLARAGLTTPASFRRGFDTALLLGEEDLTCRHLANAPALSPTFPARIFCLARQGDWDAAVLSLGTARALGYISQEQDLLLSWFLDPDLFEGDPFLPKPGNPTPLTFRLYEAIGQHIATHTLPLAFAQADLRANIGWKARAEAGERLARVGAVSDNQIFGLYTERKPAASGGVWDRMAAVQALDTALKKRDIDTLNVLLPALWTRLEEVDLELPFSRIFGPELNRFPLAKEAAWVALRMGLMSNASEQIARQLPADPGPAPRAAILRAIALGDTTSVVPVDAETQAVLEGFAARTMPTRLSGLVDQDRVGEAILRAIALFSNGSLGDLDEVSDAIAFFRQIGLEDTARAAALQFLILDRRG